MAKVIVIRINNVAKETLTGRVFFIIVCRRRPIITKVVNSVHKEAFAVTRSRKTNGSSCLNAVFRVYQMDYPDYRFYDTLAASRRHFGSSLPNHQLQTVAEACGYDLTNHHHALADAEACAAIALRIL